MGWYIIYRLDHNNEEEYLRSDYTFTPDKLESSILYFNTVKEAEEFIKHNQKLLEDITLYVESFKLEII